MRGRTDILRYEEAMAFEPEEFAHVFNMVARRSGELAARRKRGLQVTGGDERAVAGRARGAVLSEAFAPVRERYEGDALRYHSAVHRMTALAKLIKSSHLSEWMKVTGEGVAVDDAVLATAATMPLTREGEFPAGDFLKEVRWRASGRK